MSTFYMSSYRLAAVENINKQTDKAAPDSREEAKRQFQELAFAYAVLSDERRRQRYDATGSTDSVLDSSADDGFDWMDFYRDQFSSLVDTDAIDRVRREYQGSEQEQKDLLAAFENAKGDMDCVYDAVMLSNVLDDDKRFRALIDRAIADGAVRAWRKYTDEPEKKRAQRLKRAQHEAAEAAELIRKLESKKSKGKDKGPPPPSHKDAVVVGDGDNNDLAALIQQRQKDRAASFFDKLEAKYARQGNAAGKQRKNGQKRTVEMEEPPEEAFAATGARKSARKRSRA